MAYTLTNAQVFYGGNVYPLSLDAFGAARKLDGTPIKRFKMAETLRRAGVHLSVAQIAERMEVKRIPAAYNPETGARFHPELVTCYGCGFSATWARDE